MTDEDLMCVVENIETAETKTRVRIITAFALALAELGEDVFQIVEDARAA